MPGESDTAWKYWFTICEGRVPAVSKSSRMTGCQKLTVCVSVCVCGCQGTHTRRFKRLRSILLVLSSRISQKAKSGEVLQLSSGASSAPPPGNNFTCMSPAPWLSTLYSTVSSSYVVDRRGDATSLPFRLVSVSSHHSHSRSPSLPPSLSRMKVFRYFLRGSLSPPGYRLRLWLTCRSAALLRCPDSRRSFAALAADAETASVGSKGFKGKLKFPVSVSVSPCSPRPPCQTVRTPPAAATAAASRSNTDVPTFRSSTR